MNKVFLMVLGLNFIVMCFTYLKVEFTKSFKFKFKGLMVLMFLMMTFNTYCMMSPDVFKVFLVMITLSFYSMFLMCFGYGVGLKVSLIIIFKILADMILMVMLGYMFLQNGVNSFMIFMSILEDKEVFDSLMVMVFSMYSVLGMFGFWMYWAMEASYFVSCYIHSCGFISLGVLVLYKLTYYKILKDNSPILVLVYMVCILSFMFLILMAFNIKDPKKSFGYYSAANMNLLFMFLIDYSKFFMIYFLMSSLGKIDNRKLSGH